MHIGKDSDRGQGDDGAGAGHGFEAADIVPPVAGQLAQEMIERPNLFRGLLPHGPMETDVPVKLRDHAERLEQSLPAAGTAQAGLGPCSPARPAQEALLRIHLGSLDPDEVPPSRQGGAQATDGRRGYVHD